jgi:transmembrane sensor
MKNAIDFRLLDRVLSGEATPAERAQVEQRAAQDAELRQLLAELPRAVSAGGPPSWDTDAAWTRLAKTAAQGGGRARSAHWRLAAVAAVLVLGLGGVYTYNAWRARSAQEALASQVYRTAVGERRTVRLPDGSTVVLAPLSELRVSTDPVRAREVQLVGQAFFDVVSESARVFTVLTRNAATRVLGTSFMVSEYATDRAADVLVVSGRVALGSRRKTGQPPTVLERGQAGRISEDGALIVRAGIDPSDHIAWTQGRLVFRDERFADLVPALARWYGADIRLADDALGATRVTALFEGQTLDEVLQVLAETVGARYTRSGNQITFSK